MAFDTYTPSFAEIFEKVGKLKTKKEKVTYLQNNNTDALRMIIKSSFDPSIKWLLPEGSVPYVPNEAPEGTEAVANKELSKVISTSTVGTPLLSIISRPCIFLM